MLTISPEDITARLRADNPWWGAPLDTTRPPFSLPRRDYFAAFTARVLGLVRRAVILLGARRVGKTTLLHQLIGDCVAERRFPAVLFASVDTPTYTDLSLEQLLDFFIEAAPHDPAGPRLVVFDEIQYLKNWERHLKDLVDRFPMTRFVASGSAAAALKRKSDESGAGRFTDFELPPLTFAEFVRFRGLESDLIAVDETMAGVARYRARDIASLNVAFVDYVNFGGYPEAVVTDAVRRGFTQFVGRDIVDKVLLRDLPVLYGIQDIPELNRLFKLLAYNTGQEVSLEALSQNAGVAKPTITRYLDYLEAAFLVYRVRRVDENARRFRRPRGFKVHLTNPSMRAALFGPVAADGRAMGALAETAVHCQWLHAPEHRELHYAHWNDGEVDVVRLDPATQQPSWAYDVKWSDHHATRPHEVAALLDFARRTGLEVVGATTLTVHAVHRSVEPPPGVELRLFPTSLHAYVLGRLSASEDAELRAVLALEGAMPRADGTTGIPGAPGRAAGGVA
jgi:hypothetical protein